MTLVSLPHTFQDGIAQIASGDDVMDNFNAIATVLNGNVDASNVATRSLDGTRLTTALARELGVANGAIVPRGSSVIAGAESLNVSSYTAMPTAGTVTVDAPSNGILRILAYCEMAAFANAVVPKAALFLDGTQIAGPGSGAGYNLEATFTVDGASWIAGTYYAVQPSIISSVPNLYVAGTGGAGLFGIELAEMVSSGSHTVQWRFKTSGGEQIAARNRRLFVKVEDYA